MPTIVANCIVCNCDFEYLRPEGASGRLRRTCSPECHAERQKELNRKYRVEGRYPPIPKKLTHHRQCAVCGVAFRTSNSQTECCGTTCGAILGVRRSSAARSANAAARRTRHCEACRQTFVMRNPSGAARRGEVREGRFCSRACAATALRKPTAPPR